MTQPNPWNQPSSPAPPPPPAAAFGPPGGPQPPVLGYGGYGGPGGTPKPRGMAVASLVLGICSLAFCILPYANLCLVPVLGILAVVFGILGRSAVRRGEADGDGMALAGLILGSVALGLMLLVLLLGLLGVGLASWGAMQGGSGGGF